MRSANAGELTRQSAAATPASRKIFYRSASSPQVPASAAKTSRMRARRSPRQTGALARLCEGALDVDLQHFRRPQHADRRVGSPNSAGHDQAFVTIFVEAIDEMAASAVGRREHRADDGKLTCPPWVWPDRVKAMRSGVAAKMYGSCASRIAGASSRELRERPREVVGAVPMPAPAPVGQLIAETRRSRTAGRPCSSARRGFRAGECAPGRWPRARCARRRAGWSESPPTTNHDCQEWRTRPAALSGRSKPRPRRPAERSSKRTGACTRSRRARPSDPASWRWRARQCRRCGVRRSRGAPRECRRSRRFLSVGPAPHPGGLIL